MRPAAYFLRFATLTAILVPALEVAAMASQRPALFAQNRSLQALASVTTVEDRPRLELLRLPTANSRLTAQADGRQSAAQRLFQQGLEAYNRRQFRQAITAWEQALEMVRATGNRQDEGTILNALGEAFRQLSQYEQAIGFYEEAVNIAREVGDRAGEGRALGNLGNAYLSLGNQQQAIALYQQHLAIAREIKDLQGEANALANLGNTYDRIGNYEQALDFSQQALGVIRQLGDRGVEETILRNVGNVYWNLGEYQQAINLFEQALAIARETDNRVGASFALNGLGEAYRSLGEYQQAIDFYQQALSIARQVSHRAAEGLTLRNLGNVYWNLGEYQQAIDFYQQHLVIAREIRDVAGEGKTLNNLGEAYRNLGEYQQAIDFYQQALVILRRFGDRDGESTVLNNLGIAFKNLGEPQQAINFHQQSLAIAREIGDRDGEGRSLGNLGLIYASLGQYDQALDQLRQAAILFNRLGARAEEGQVLGFIGKLLDRQDQPALAIVFLKASVDVREAIRGDIRGLDTSLQQSFTNIVAEDYRLLADLLLQQNRIIEAQRVLDLLKVQELDNYLQDVQRNAQTESGVDYLRPEETILARYDDLQTSAITAGQELDDIKAIAPDQRTDRQVQRIAQLTALLDDINGDFRDFARSPEIRELIDQLSFEAQEASLSLNQLDRLRDELQQLNAAIFYPLILEDRLELVITVPDSPPLRRTVNVSREELNTAILEFRTALTDPNTDAKTPAQQLYDWLIRPLEEDLSAAGIETIIYSPDGQLRYIPLAALHDDDDWLIQRYRINNITAESLTDLTASNTSQPKILAAAYTDESLVHMPEVNGRTYTFSGLPGAGLEVDLLPTATKFFDEDFSLEAVRPVLDEYNILHFATHAAFVPGVPEDSFILFGNGDTPTLRDVENWSLNGVDLVVLSACETGVGGLGNGEEILGLGYQFQVSGAKSVMSSLWQVSDLGTQVLMNEFYQALSTGITKAEALQIAQTALINQAAGVNGLDLSDRGIEVVSARNEASIANGNNSYSHPYYWAPFILIGNGL
ncbi:MAG: tetratricopeptide repeat protein [Leptolyngbya sp. SIOISBB]|nr:tetratricopeptide repeat protein [Leptolyngbya sp. SIOISBB]